MARTTFSGPVHSKNGFVGDMKPTAPNKVFSGDAGEYDATEHPGAIINDSGVLKFSDGTDWKVIDLT